MYDGAGRSGGGDGGGVGASADQVQRIREQFRPRRARSSYASAAGTGAPPQVTSASPSSSAGAVAQAIAERLARHARPRRLGLRPDRVLGVDHARHHRRAPPAQLGRPRRHDPGRRSACRLPGFWLGLILIVLFSVMRDWLPGGRLRPVSPRVPASGSGHSVLPAASPRPCSRSASWPASRARPLPRRSARTYVRTARAKGLSGLGGRRPARARQRHDPGRHGARDQREPAPVGLGRGRDRVLHPGPGPVSWPPRSCARDYPVIQGGLLAHPALLFVGDQPRRRPPLRRGSIPAHAAMTDTSRSRRRQAPRSGVAPRVASRSPAAADPRSSALVLCSAMRRGGHASPM